MAIYTPPVPEPRKYGEIPSELYQGTTTRSRKTRNRSLGMLLVGVVVTLFTYQYFHNGLWGKLTNFNKLPLIVLNGTTVQGNNLDLELYRPNGPDTYGSFVEQVSISTTGTTTTVEIWTPKELSKIGKTAIQNTYPYQQVKTGPWGLVVPLAAKASVQLPLSPSAVSALHGASQVKVTVEDVSGTKWTYVTKTK